MVDIDVEPEVSGQPYPRAVPLGDVQVRVPCSLRLGRHIFSNTQAYIYKVIVDTGYSSCGPTANDWRGLNIHANERRLVESTPQGIAQTCTDLAAPRTTCAYKHEA